MTPDDLAKAQEERDRARAAQLFDARAKQLIGDVDGNRARLRSRRTMAERCRKNWPKLTDEEVDATIDRANELAAEMAERRARLVAEACAEREADERDPMDQPIAEPQPITGRRLEGAELEEARRVMSTTKEAMTTERAIEHAVKRMTEDRAVSVATVHREVKAEGWEGSYQAFYAGPWKKAKAQLAAANGATKAEAPQPTNASGPLTTGHEMPPSTSPSAGTADTEEGHDLRASASEPPAGEETAVSTSTPSKPAFDPATGSGTFLILALQASRLDGGTRITATLDADGDPTQAIAEFASRLRSPQAVR